MDGPDDLVVGMLVVLGADGRHEAERAGDEEPAAAE
jgi:hypothetical protein